MMKDADQGPKHTLYLCMRVFIQSVSGGIVNILGGGSIDYSE